MFAYGTKVICKVNTLALRRGDCYRVGGTSVCGKKVWIDGKWGFYPNEMFEQVQENFADMVLNKILSDNKA